MKKLEDLSMKFIKPYIIECREAEIVFWLVNMSEEKGNKYLK
jgi:hypothetical protein